MKTLLILILLLTFGCTDPVKKDFNREGETLEAVVQFSKDLRKDSWDYREGLTGQALYSPDDNLCDIIVSSKLSFVKQQETLGHELMHCLYGDYHK